MGTAIAGGAAAAAVGLLGGALIEKAVHDRERDQFGGFGYNGLGETDYVRDEVRSKGWFGGTEEVRQEVRTNMWGDREVVTEVVDRDMFGRVEDVEVTERDDFGVGGTDYVR